MSRGYSRAQIVLHWSVALLVLAQFLNNGAIAAAWSAIREGAAQIPASPLIAAHVAGGIAILALTLWRIALRITRGAPPPPADEPRALRIVAAATHGSLYLLLVLLAVSGLAAWFGGAAPAAGVHALLKTLLMLVVVLHVAGALYQRFVLRSDAVARMLRAEP